MCDPHGVCHQVILPFQQYKVINSRAKIMVEQACPLLLCHIELHYTEQYKSLV